MTLRGVGSSEQCLGPADLQAVTKASSPTQPPSSLPPNKNTCVQTWKHSQRSSNAFSRFASSSWVIDSRLRKVLLLSTHCDAKRGPSFFRLRSPNHTRTGRQASERPSPSTSTSIVQTSLDTRACATQDPRGQHQASR